MASRIKTQGLVLWQLWRYEWQASRQHPCQNALLWWLPLLMLALLAWIFSAGPARNLSLLVVDQDQSASSRQLLRLLNASPGLEVQAWPGDLPGAEQALRQRQAYGVLAIPAQFEQQLLQGQGQALPLWHNAQLATHSSQIEREVQQGLQSFTANFETSQRQRQGSNPEQARQQTQPIKVQATALHNASMDYQRFLQVPMSFAMLQLFVLLASLHGLGRELRDGSLNQYLQQANGSRTLALLAKTSFYGLWSWLWALALLAYFAWRLPDFEPSVGLGLATGMLVGSGVGLAWLFLGVTLNLRFSLSVCGFYAAPAFAFAGQTYPLVSMPVAAQLWAQLMPLTPWLSLYNQSGLGPVPWLVGQTQLLHLSLLAVLPAVLGGLLLRQRAFTPTAWRKR